MQIAANTSLRALLKTVYSTYPAGALYSPDNDTLLSDQAKPSVRYYAPQVLGSDPIKTLLCTVDVIHVDVGNAQTEGDKLLNYLATNKSRFPKMESAPRASTFRESNFARCNIQFLLKQL